MNLSNINNDAKIAASDIIAVKDINISGNNGSGSDKGTSLVKLNIGFGSSKSTYDETGSSTVAHGNSLTAGGQVNVTAREGDLHIKGSTIDANEISLAAAKAVDIVAAENRSRTDGKSSSSSYGAGVVVDFGTKGVVGGAYAEASKAKGKTNTDATSYTASEITAADKLNIRSGKDTNIIGSKVSGNKVEADVGGNLNIESLQEQSSYASKSTSGGVSMTYSPLGGVTGNVSASSNRLDNNYKSVTEQAGIYAGSEGFDINVKGNTDLKGAVIDSTATADRNSLTTGTLSVSDIANSSETKSSGIGLSYDGEKSNSSTAMLGDKGLIPNIPMATNESDSSTTKSGIAEGSITITKPSGQKQDVSQINRNTEGAANVLKNSFDPQKVQERQETAALFGELAANAIHEIAKRNGWKDGSPEKIAMHAAAAAVMAGITRGDITAAAITGGSTEALSNTIIKAVGNDKGSSAEAQWAAAVVGAALSSATGGDAQSGASIAANAVKNNELHRMTPASAENTRKQIAQNIYYTDESTGEKYSWYLNERGEKVDLVLKPLPESLDFKLKGDNSDFAVALFSATVDKGTSSADGKVVDSKVATAGRAVTALTLGVIILDDGQKYGFGSNNYVRALSYDVGAIATGIYGGKLGTLINSDMGGLVGGTIGYYVGDYYAKEAKDALVEERRGK